MLSTCTAFLPRPEWQSKAYVRNVSYKRLTTPMAWATSCLSACHASSPWAWRQRMRSILIPCNNARTRSALSPQASISATSCVTLVLASRGFEVAGRVQTSLDDGAQPFVAHHAGQALGVSFGADYFRFTLVITKQPDSHGGLPLENAVCTDFRGAMWRPLWHWEPFVGGNIHRCI